MEECKEVAERIVTELLQRMGISTEVKSFMKDETLYIEIKSDEGGILIGKHGRTLESLQVLINRMVNKKVENPIRVVIDIADYKKRREDSLKKMVSRLGENAKRTGKGVTVGPYNAYDRRIIHITLKENPYLKTESIGEGDWKKIRIIPTK